jgi:aryl-alcohol dehydrogenase-like predicted oxidoreductase
LADQVSGEEKQMATTLSRRDWLSWNGGALAVSSFARLFDQEKMLTKPIPSSGEQLPVIGLGSSATFAETAQAGDVAELREVMMMLVEHGGKIFDTSPDYGASEAVAGRIASEALIANKIFWATKVNVAPENGRANRAAARAQIDRSFRRLRKRRIDLIQVHNLGDVPTQLGLLKELKAQGRVRYIGVTSTLSKQYDDLVKIMKSEPLDFIGVNYAVDDRAVENIILPLAQDREIAVLAYSPFGRTRLFHRVGGRPLPDWAAEFDAKTWAQFFLKFVVSHPSILAATPATSQAKNMLDNIGAGLGKMPDEATRKRMAAFVDALPAAT